MILQPPIAIMFPKKDIRLKTEPVTVGTGATVMVLDSEPDSCDQNKRQTYTALLHLLQAWFLCGNSDYFWNRLKAHILSVFVGGGGWGRGEA